MQEAAHTHLQILSIIAPQGAGKSTVGKQLAEDLNAQHIEVSSVVRALTGVSNRAELPETRYRTIADRSWLARGIWDRIKKPSVVLTGVREHAVHDYFESMDVHLSIVELWSPENERYKRVSKQGKVKSYQDFKQHDENDLKVGLGKIINNGYPVFVTTYYTPEETVRQILDVLDPVTWRIKGGQVLG